ncbi:MAG: hypothetical protein ACREFP_21885, partial [Acetobacteraceae bacterium]
DRTLAALRATPLAREKFPASVTEFREHMHAVAASGSYAEIMVAMLAAEWMYATWCGRAAGRPIGEPHLARWVALHAAPEFTRQVAWLAQQVDAAGAAASALDQELLVRRFGETLRLEFGFHTAALKSPLEA